MHKTLYLVVKPLAEAMQVEPLARSRAFARGYQLIFHVLLVDQADSTSLLWLNQLMLVSENFSFVKNRHIRGLRDIINGYFADKQPCLTELDDLADLQYFSLLGSWQSPKVFDNAISSVIVRKQLRFTVILPFSLLYVASDEVDLHTVSIFDNQLDPRNKFVHDNVGDAALLWQCISVFNCDQGELHLRKSKDLTFHVQAQRLRRQWNGDAALVYPIGGVIEKEMGLFVPSLGFDLQRYRRGLSQHSCSFLPSTYYSAFKASCCISYSDFQATYSTFLISNPNPFYFFYKPSNPSPLASFFSQLRRCLILCSFQLYLLCLMSNSKENEQCMLSIKTVTWQKDSHSLFDYEFNKNVVQATFDYDLTPKYLYMFRNNSNCQISFEVSSELEYKVPNNLQLLGCLQLKQDNKRHKIEFFNSSFIKQKNSNYSQRTNSSNSPTEPKKEDDIYLIVRSLKNKNNQNKGYKLKNGQVVKLGRVEYLITSANANQQGENKAKFWSITKKIIVGENSQIDLAKEECKYCYMGQTEEPDGFLCSPCKCSGSCGLVHFRCLEKWNQSKVKKEVVGGTIQYNFQKFYCEVCKDEYPRYIEKNNVEYELLPIQKPKGDHVILQGISEKANNMMVIQNVSAQGIKLGRGHDCQIRVTDISVSRNHAKIQKIGSQYFVFDNKSKFGTLVRQDHLEIELSRIKQGIQIGRTVMTFQKVKKA